MPKKPEARINLRLKKALDLFPQLCAHRVESKTSVGEPDWQIHLDGGKVAFVETKFMYNLSNPLKNWKPTQRNWAEQHLRRGFVVYLLLGDENSTLLLNAADHIKTDKIVHILGRWKTKIDPDHLYAILTENQNAI
jgi:hypothetical protein